MPESDEQSGTAFADRQTRRQTAHKMGVTYDRAIQAFDRLEAALDKEEEGASSEQRRWGDRKKRRESDECARGRAEDRADIRQDVWAEERRRAMRHRDVLLGLTAITTLLAVGLAYLAVAQNQVEFIGASMFSTALSAVEVYVMRWTQGPQGETAGLGHAVVEPPPFKWSVLDLQPEAEERADCDGEDAAPEG